MRYGTTIANFFRIARPGIFGALILKYINIYHFERPSIGALNGPTQ